ncbi:DUF21 domain-containing protein [Chitinispirillales bacterium ANBcel5]|uniref:CNNM domain-containing protein n=1 Tax=Cellulosispirillum alkaliphilum TaxID=3039283 RepID=UPI002A51251B|nr:DUF21 domain-containing protein [Chitinispirillales bacterium ANBcel5]
MAYQLTLFLICVAGSFFFSGSETGFISWNTLKVAHRAGLGNLKARLALYLMNHKERFLTTILIANNLCNVGATLAFINIFILLDQILPLDVGQIPSPESWFLTPVMVLFGEMLPKTLFRIYPFRMTFKSIPLLAGVYVLAYPFSYILALFTKILGRSSIDGSESYKTKVREEVLMIAGEGARRGTLFETVDTLIDNAFHLKDITVGEIAYSIGDWINDYGCIRRSLRYKELIQNITEDEEVVIFDDDCTTPVGYFNILDVAFLDERADLNSIVRKLPKMKNDVSLLECVRKIKEDAPRFYLIEDKNGQTTAILDRRILFKKAFVKISPEYLST